MAQRLIAGALLAVALVAVAPFVHAGEAGDPRTPKLDGGVQPPPAPVDAPSGARPVPPTVAICQDATARQCWLARTATECGPPPAALFRLVISEVGRPDMADALAACRDAVRP